jgi:hypothetical protein
MEAQMSQPAAPPAAPGAAPPMEASIEDFIDSKEGQNNEALSGPEMGVKPGGEMGAAKYAHVYGHYRCRAVKGGIEVFDPNDKRAIFTARLKASVMADQRSLFNAATKILASVVTDGITVTAQRCKVRVAESVIDDADFAQTEKPSDTKTNSSQTDVKVQQTDQPSKGEKGILPDATFSQTETPADGAKAPTGLDGGKLAKKAGTQDGGGLPGYTIPENKELNSTTGGSMAAKDKPEEMDGGASALDDVTLPFATKAQLDNLGDNKAEPFGKDDGEEKTASIAEIAERYRRHYANKAAKDVKAAMRLFTQRFARSVMLATTRQGKNLDHSTLKEAMFDALTTEGRVAANEQFIPMDERTAQFCVERGLSHRAQVEAVTSIVKRAAHFMKASDETIAQLEQDVNEQGVVNAQLDDAMNEVVDAGAAMPGMPQPEAPLEGQMDMGGAPGGMPPMEGQVGAPPPPAAGGMPMEGQVGALPPPAGGMGGMEGQADPNAPPQQQPMGPVASRAQQAMRGNPVTASRQEEAPSQGRMSLRAALSATPAVRAAEQFARR